MKLTKRSTLTGKTHTKDLPITNDELYRHHKGELAQNIWPKLSKDDREFIISGITVEEWDDAFKNEE